MFPLRPSSPPIRTATVAVVLVLAVTAPATVAAVAAPSTAEQSDAAAASAMGNLSATLPPPDAGPGEVRPAAESGRLVPTDDVHPNGTVIFRLNDSTAAAPGTDPALGDDLRFSMRQTPHSTSPERLPLRLNASRSGDAVRTFVVDADRYVVVDLRNATWEYDGEPGTHALGPRPRAGHAYTATLAITANGTTVSRNTTVQMTEPAVRNGSEAAAGSVAQFTVSMPGTWTATVVLGNESAGVRAAIQVVDEDADGVVRVRVDTAASTPEAAFAATGPDTVRPADDGFTTWSGSLPPGEYRLGAGVGTPEAVAADRYRWNPALTVVEPANGSATPTATARPTPTQSPTPTESATPTGSATATVPRTTTESPGFGAVTALLALLAAGTVAGRRE